jgi:hypothetical protein
VQIYISNYTHLYFPPSILPHHAETLTRTKTNKRKQPAQETAKRKKQVPEQAPSDVEEDTTEELQLQSDATSPSTGTKRPPHNLQGPTKLKAKKEKGLAQAQHRTTDGQGHKTNRPPSHPSRYMRVHVRARADADT